MTLEYQLNVNLFLIVSVVNQDYKPHIPRAHVLAGNTGVLTCTVPAPLQDHISVTSWYMDDTIVLPSIIDNGRSGSKIGTNLRESR